ncbi:HDL223Cp [Eremothecium sinecaudum]|uniref:Protein kish n=1 Tax=Eremothecium sinecaudum TaxID=45286 RepID=A0A109UZ03_9SACH|nr:HDL223Cp [Eremothecium sinecaudum]AMD20521.1 HDL223Cp [Eremothecium sinecaudum]
MSALFKFASLLQVLLLLICSSTYVHTQWPSLLQNNNQNGILRVFWKFARIGERASPYVSLACILMAINQFNS